MKKPQIAIVMGSDSDYEIMKDAADVLKKFSIEYSIDVLSAHRTPHDAAIFAEGARENGIRVLIAGAGGAAHLPGVLAAYTELPVIGVPIPYGPLQGEDALLAIVQMPKGVPVATVAIGNAWNAGILAAQILAAGGEIPDKALTKKITEFKAQLRDDVRKKRKKFES